jgi:peroxiredoxin
MVELGQLEEHHAEFQDRNARIFAVSLDDVDDAAITQKKFPDLTILADPNAKLVGAIHAIHPGGGPGGADAAAPTTLILNSKGTIRWIKRGERFLERPAPEEVLTALDKYLTD